MNTLVQFVNMPRSGHHYLVDLLFNYFNDGALTPRRLAYCEYYQCCKHRPCNLSKERSAASSKEINLQKSHDEYLHNGIREFEPPLELRNEIRHLVQIRHPIPSTISEYHLVRSLIAASYNGSEIDDKTESHETEDGWTAVRFNRPMYIDWMPFAIRQLQYRNRFLKKWVLENPWVESENYCFLDYEDLVIRPKENLRRIIKFLSPGESVDNTKIDSVCRAYPVHAPKDPRDFEFSSTLPDLNKLCQDTWQACRDKLGNNLLNANPALI